MPIKYRIPGNNQFIVENMDELTTINNYNEVGLLSINDINFTEKFTLPPNLYELYILNCHGCEFIDKLPNDIRLVSIKYTDISDINRLFIGDYPNIETLDVSYNRIETFPRNLPNNLVSLNLSNNSIAKMPEINCLPKDITHVDITFNKFNDLPSWVADISTNIKINLFPNKYWFSSYSNISLNRKIEDHHIKIAQRYFSGELVRKMLITRGFSTEPDFPSASPQPRKLTHEEYQEWRRNQRRARENLLNRYPNGNNLAVAPPVINGLAARKTTAEQAQNVHNSDIQDSFSKSVSNIMKFNAPKISNYLNQIKKYYFFDGFNIVSNTKFIFCVLSNCRENIMVSKCGVTYNQILQKIWEISNINPHKKEIRRILRNEINDGIGYCFTGRVTRLVNSLSGFVDGIQVGYSENEQINNAVIATIRRCEANPELKVLDEVRKVLTELNVPEERQTVWLDVLE